MKTKLSTFIRQTLVFMSQGVYDMLDRPNWSKGDALYSKVTNGDPSVVSGQLVNFYPIINTDALLETKLPFFCIFSGFPHYFFPKTVQYKVMPLRTALS
jgi:hypothetical protein